VFELDNGHLGCGDGEDAIQATVGFQLLTDRLNILHKVQLLKPIQILMTKGCKDIFIMFNSFAFKEEQASLSTFYG